MDDDQIAGVIEPEERERRDPEDERWDDHPDSEEWYEDEEDEELPPRPRNRLLRPLPIALIAVLIAACGFLGGVLVQKGSEGESAGGMPGGAGDLSGLLSEAGGEEAGGEGGAELPAGLGGGSEAAVTGTVSSVDGRTIYVTDSEGNTVAVKAGDGSTISRDSNVSAKEIHPGDSVVVQGSKNGSTVKASSISATEEGVESSTLGFGGMAEAGGGEEGSDSLFGE